MATLPPHIIIKIKKIIIIKSSKEELKIRASQYSLLAIPACLGRHSSLMRPVGCPNLLLMDVGNIMPIVRAANQLHRPGGTPPLCQAVQAITMPTREHPRHDPLPIVRIGTYPAWFLLLCLTQSSKGDIPLYCPLLLQARILLHLLLSRHGST